MIKSKFIQLLRSLNSKELKEFRSFLNGLYSKQEKALLLFEYIIKYAPDYESNKLDKAYVLQKKFNNHSGKTKRVSNELHKLFDWLEQFLLLKNLQSKENELAKAKLLRDIYKSRQLNHFFDRKVEAIDKIIHQLPNDSWRHLHLLELHHNQYYYSPTEKLKKKEGGIHKAIKSLDHFCQIKKLKYECEIWSIENILGQTDLSLSLKKDKVLTDELFSLYQKLSKLITGKTLESYQDLKKDLFYKSHGLAQEEQLILLSYLINYTSTWILKGDRQGFVEAFELYQHGIEQNILVENGVISEGNFHNIINIACELGEYTWAKHFVRNYKTYLLPDIQTSAKALAQARISFSEKKFDVTLELLLGIEYKNISYLLQAKLLQVRSYYELGKSYSSSLNYYIQSFDLFLVRNKKINKQMIKSYRNFLMILKLLHQGHLSKKKLEALLNTQTTIVCKSWIKQKIRNYKPLNS